jgi:hypothetical protein
LPFYIHKPFYYYGKKRKKKIKEEEKKQLVATFLFRAFLHILPPSPLSPFYNKKINFYQKVVSDVTSETTF